MTEDWMRAWDPVRALVGSDISKGEARPAADRVEPGAIRRYLEPLEFDCGLHSDADVARAHGFGDVIAPYTAIASFAMPPLRTPGQRLFTEAARNAKPGRGGGVPKLPPGAPPVTANFATDLAVEFVRPVVAGELLARRGNRLVSCEPKETRVGRGAFVKTESLVLDETGGIVARYYTGLFLYDPHPRESAAVVRPRPERVSNGAPFAPPAEALQPSTAAQQRRWRDVRVGDRIAPIAFPITVFRLVVAAGANRDFNPIHHNSEVARAGGARDMYANSTFLQGMWERAARDYIGLAGTIRRLGGFRMNSFNVAGDVVVVGGEVTRTWQEGGVGCIAIAMRSENDGKVSVGPGEIVATLPL